MFTAGADLLDRARQFQAERRDVVHTNSGPLGNLKQDGRLILHIIPFTALSQESVIDLRQLNSGELIPIWCTGCNYGYNVHGYWTTSDSYGCSGYVQVFRNGIIETAAADIRIIISMSVGAFTRGLLKNR